MLIQCKLLNRQHWFWIWVGVNWIKPNWNINWKCAGEGTPKNFICSCEIIEHINWETSFTTLYSSSLISMLRHKTSFNLFFYFSRFFFCKFICCLNNAAKEKPHWWVGADLRRLNWPNFIQEQLKTPANYLLFTLKVITFFQWHKRLSLNNLTLRIRTLNGTLNLFFECNLISQEHFLL